MIEHFTTLNVKVEVQCVPGAFEDDGNPTVMTLFIIAPILKERYV